MESGDIKDRPDQDRGLDAMIDEIMSHPLFTLFMILVLSFCFGYVIGARQVISWWEESIKKK